MSTEVGKQAVEDAWFAGLASIAVNFTGGETFQPRSNLPELVELDFCKLRLTPAWR